MPDIDPGTNFRGFVVAGVAAFALLGVVTLLTFKLIFGRLERRQAEEDEANRT